MMISKRGLLKSVNLLFEKVQHLESAITCVDNRKGLATVNQLQCAAKGHNFVFEKKTNYDCLYRPKYAVMKWVMKYDYQFKCTNCDLTITKTADELTPTEKKALKDLGILEEKDEQDSKTKTTN